MRCFLLIGLTMMVGCVNHQLQILPYTITVSAIPPSVSLSSPGGIINYGPLPTPTPSPVHN